MWHAEASGGRILAPVDITLVMFKSTECGILPQVLQPGAAFCRR